MLASFDCKNVHAILVSESWLKPCLPSTVYTLPGFQLIRNDRTSGGGGGVAIYLRSYISFSIIDISAQPPPSNAGEHLFLELTMSHTKILLGVYYCPSLRINFFSSLERILEDFATSYSHIIIMGDFNTCLLKNDSRSASLQAVIGSSNLSILPLNATHHFPHSTPSLLDLIFVSSPDHVAKHGQCSADAFSYHDLIFLSYKIRPPKAKSRVLLQRNFGGMDLENLREDAANIDWGTLFTSESVDEKVELFSQHLIALYDVHAPIRTVRVRHLPSPWLTKDLKLIMAKKAAAKSRYKARTNTTNWEKYVNIRNHCNKATRLWNALPVTIRRAQSLAVFKSMVKNHYLAL
ncbi:hypothetical protein B5X24_HaOG211900 [Helicoverpa armigera]|nr:hypothetical protein B5X24_HaOG211900 [Helicoverpa armigera]